MNRYWLKIASWVLAVLAASVWLVPAQQNAAQDKGAKQGAKQVTAVPVSNEDPPAKIPIGFTSIFNGTDLTGWHISKTNHHGATPDYHVSPGGILLGSQNPVGGGGVLLTDKKYKNVEV